MAMTVIETATIADGALPVDRLAGQMRLADGVTTDSEQSTRLRLRLRAAIDMIERKIGRVLLSRSVTVGGTTADGRRLSLPIGPVSSVLDAWVDRGGVNVDLPGSTIEQSSHRAVVVLALPVRQDEFVRLTLSAGYGDWPDLPDGLSQAVLLTAEALDGGAGDVLTPMALALLAPYRDVRIGGVSR